MKVDMKVSWAEIKLPCTMQPIFKKHLLAWALTQGEMI